VSRAASAVAGSLAQIAQHDAAVGAFVDVFADRATTDAADRDRAPLADQERPLHGVPVAIKELFDVEGADGSYGSNVLAGRRSERDAAVVGALRAAGAVVIGTTRSHEFGWGITTQHAGRGSTRNPWNLERVPGGSSGGSAAAVAAGMVPLALGSDTGGSIRLPAAFCGVLGLKTTFGRISRAGGVALAPSFDSPGFLARDVALLAAAFAATAGSDPDDASTVTAPPVGPALVGTAPEMLAGLRFATPAGLSPERLDAPRTAAVEAVCAALVALGLQRHEVAMPDARAMLDTFVPIQMAEALHVHTSVLRTYPDRAGDYGADVRARLETAQSVTLAQHLTARRGQDDVKVAFANAFASTDLLVGAVGPTGPSLAADADTVLLHGKPVAMRTAMMMYTVPQNLAGLPSITCPCGVDDSGMPIGIQITGPWWSEPLLLAVAGTLEAAGTIGVVSPPSFPAPSSASPTPHAQQPPREARS
jgi:aspartyl-tRNA(Asn)/glutamyl-tRNA(Gln) amidotransferase subunit A